jgi:hypothetical protein
LAFVSGVRDVTADDVDMDAFTMEQVESNIVRCPDAAVAERMIAAIDEVRTRGDSCGGVVTCVCRNVPRGLGAPVFDKLEADLAHAMLSLPATKGFEVGSGFSGTRMKGTEHNDEFYLADGLLRTRSNRSGGIQGGISNGENIVLRIAFKPTSTVTQPQQTVTRAGEATELRARGRHDPCVVPRAVPMVEAMAALVLVDHLLQQQAQCNLLGRPVPPELLYGNMPTLYDAAVRRSEHACVCCALTRLRVCAGCARGGRGGGGAARGKREGAGGGVYGGLKRACACACDRCACAACERTRVLFHWLRQRLLAPGSRARLSVCFARAQRAAAAQHSAAQRSGDAAFAVALLSGPWRRPAPS